VKIIDLYLLMIFLNQINEEFNNKLENSIIFFVQLKFAILSFYSSSDKESISESLSFGGNDGSPPQSIKYFTIAFILLLL